MHKMKIAMITTYPPDTGTLNEYAFHFVRNLSQKDREVAELYLLVNELDADKIYETQSQHWGDVPVHIVPSWRFNHWHNTWRLLKAVRTIQPDIVLSNIQFATFGNGKIPATLGLLSAPLIKWMGFPSVILLHNIMETINLQDGGYSSNALYEQVIRLFGNVVTRTLLLSDWVALTIPKYVEILEEKYGAKNVLLAPHGSFAEPVEPTFELPDGPMQIMTFGKFGTYKKVEVLIQAFQRLQTDQRPPLELVIAGGDAPHTPGYLAGVAQQYAHVPNVRFTGYVPEEDVPRTFREAAVTVFPYTSTTGSSGVLHQAGDYGKAAVLPRIGDLAELVTEEGYGGEFFEPHDPVSLAEAIGKIIDNPARRIELGQRNYAASRGIPISEVVDWYLLHFENMLEEAVKNNHKKKQEDRNEVPISESRLNPSIDAIRPI